jgi:hypothetical protein
VDIAGVCAATWALYALENLQPEPKKASQPPPRAAVLEASIASTDEENLLSAAF